MTGAVLGIFDDESRRRTYLDAVVAARAEQLGIRLEEWPLTRAHVEAVHGAPDPAGLAAVERAVRDHAVARLKVLAVEARGMADQISRVGYRDGAIDDVQLAERSEWMAREGAYLAAADLVAGVVL